MQHIFEYLEVVNNRERQPSTLVGGEVYVFNFGTTVVFITGL